jgi:hypothetical protein
MALGPTQPLTEMSTRNLPGGKGRPARTADNLTAICEPIAYKNVGASTSHNPMGLHGLLHDSFILASSVLIVCSTDYFKQRHNFIFQVQSLKH